jgi:hypothetical protein
VSAEHDFEPIRGLPGDLPAGERLLWQGSPRWTRLACDAFHIRAVAAYFSLMLALRTAQTIAGGTPADKAVEQALSVAPLALAAIALIAALAWLNARTTVYSITSRRVVMRFGVALPKAINLPFVIIEGGALKASADGSGDLALTLKAPNKIAFLHLWPHARPWRLAAPQPTLRAIPDAAAVAATLATAMKAVTPIETTAVLSADRPAGPGLGHAEPAAA